MKSSVSLRVKFIVLLVSVIVAMLGMNVLWQQYSGGQRTEQELTEQARALSSNMDAVWFFMTANQDLINYDSAGNYEFKGLQCSIAGRSIGALFSRATDYRNKLRIPLAAQRLRQSRPVRTRRARSVRERPAAQRILRVR